MFDKLEDLKKKYEELTSKISDPEVMSDQNEFKKCMKEHSAIREVVEKYDEYKKYETEMKDAEELMKDPDMKEMAESEYYDCKNK